MKFRTKCEELFKRTKDNLALLVILPAVLGGVWQIFSLGNISLSFIRFFSATQVIADGMLLVTLVITLYISYAFSSLLLRHEDSGQEDSWTFKRSFAITIFSTPPFFISLLMLRRVYLEPAAIGVGSLLLTFGSFFLFIRLFLFGLIQAFLALLCRKESIQAWLQRRAEGISRTLAMLTLLALAGFLAAGLDLMTRARRWGIDPENIGNWENVDRLVRKQFPTSSGCEVLYYNDEFIFVEIKNDQVGTTSNRIVIFKFDELFSWPHESPVVAEPRLMGARTPVAKRSSESEFSEQGVDHPNTATGPKPKGEDEEKLKPESAARSR